MADTIKLEFKPVVVEALVVPNSMVPTRDGYRVIHTAPPGATMRLLGTGYAVVVCPDRLPYVVTPDGLVYDLTPGGAR